MSGPGAGEEGGIPRRRVFLSYSRDDRERALPVIAALEQGGIEVWWDGLLTGGDAFIKTTENMLETSDAVVVLWTATSVASHWVRDEATRGRERHCLVPVALDGSTPPLGFRQIHYINFKSWNGTSKSPEVDELLRAIQQVASSGGHQIEFPAALPGRSENRIGRRGLIIGGGAVAVLGGVLAGWKGGLFTGGAETDSIAVMPFENLSSNSSRAYFSDGLAEELRAMLSLNRQIEVAAQTSSNSLRDARLDAQGVARKLNVAFVLEGSVREAGEQVRIAARLIDGRSGFEKWSQQFDRKLADVLAVQSEIAALVTDSLVSTMLGSDDAKGIRVGGTRSTQAFDAYLRGAALYDLAQDENTDRQALAAFDEAVRIDPQYAVAHAARSRALTVFATTYASGREVAEWNAKALTAARRAVELTPNLAEGQSALGFNLMNAKLDLAAAQGPMELSYSLGFGNPAILTAYARYASFAGDDERAREALNRAKRLDPLNPTVWRMSGLVEFSARDFARAESELRSGLALNAKMNLANSTLGDVALIQGDAAKAEALYAAEPSTLWRLRGLAIAANRRGDQARAEKKLAEMVTEFGSNSLYQQAQVFAQWGDKARALDALEQGYAAGDAGLLLALGDPLLDPIRQDQRFAALLRRLGAAGVQG